MSSISPGIMSAEEAVEQDVTLEDVGKEILRWGLVVVVGWIGAMKFTAYEAMGIQPLVAHSPLLHWTYNFLSVRSFSTMLGFIEIGTAALIALRSVSPKASAIGSFLAIGLFLTTLSFLFSTPGWEPSLGGFPALSALPGQFLLKDIVLLGASVWSLGESLRAVEAQLFVEGGLQKIVASGQVDPKQKAVRLMEKTVKDSDSVTWQELLIVALAWTLILLDSFPR